MLKLMQTESIYRIVHNKHPPLFETKLLLKWQKNQSKWVQQVSLLVMIYKINSKFDG